MPSPANSFIALSEPASTSPMIWRKAESMARLPAAFSCQSAAWSWTRSGRAPARRSRQSPWCRPPRRRGCRSRRCRGLPLRAGRCYVADEVAARIHEVARAVELDRFAAELLVLAANLVFRGNKVLVPRGRRRLLDLPEPAGQAGLGGRGVEHDLRT